jgi:GNAT superfamily N-acetyltransferase
MSHESERIELAALKAMHEATPPSLRAALGLALHEVGGVTVSVASREPSILINRALGLGVSAPASRETVRALQAVYRQAGVRRYFLHVHPEAEPAGVRDWLAEEGLVPYRRWAQFVHDLDPARIPQPSGALRVERIGARHAADFGRIAAAGFDLTETSASMLAAMVEHPGWRLYIVFDADAPASAGAMFVHGDTAWLDFAATDPAFRSRGAHRRRLAQALADAVALGCKRVMTETGEWVEGDPQHSYRNLERAGFRMVYLRDNYVPAPSPT